ncbi:DUF5753 domain-containing protein [Actinocorallia aurantiaca]|uniref:Helix-turn-helix transcriptional regulator n=1 Tax=Actinocorallia aurantiaca TaxID=46204 RepID=A0ABN3TV95_9ACTN
MVSHIPHARRRELGQALRLRRERAGVAPAEAAAQVGWSALRLERMEDGLATIRRVDARALLELYGADDVEALVSVAAGGWWAGYADLVDDSFETLLIAEESANRMYSHHAGLVPGLLQTREYAWELMATLSDQPLDRVEQLATLRAERGRVLRRGTGLEAVFVLDEAALLRRVGGPGVMRAQYRRLAELATAPGIALHVRPMAAGPHRATDLTFHVFEFAAVASMAQHEWLDREHFTRSPEDVARYLTLFESARAGALSREDSRDLLDRLAAAC